MPTASPSSKGQVTIPKEIRMVLGLHTGDRVAFRIRDDGGVEMEPETVDLMSLCESIRPEIRGVTVEDMNEAIRRAASKT